MAELASIVLEYLRRHDFTRAEAALRLELQARQSSAGPSFSLLSEDEEVTPSSNEFFPAYENFNGDADDSGSKALQTKLMASDLQTIRWEHESANRALESRISESLVMRQKLMYEHCDHESYSRSSAESMCLPSGIQSSGETSRSPELDRGLGTQDIEFRILPKDVFQASKGDQQGVPPWHRNDQNAHRGPETSLERIIGVQSEKEECKVGHEHNTFCKLVYIQEEPLDIQTDRLNCTVENVSKDLDESFGQPGDILTLRMGRWEDCQNMVLQQRSGGFLQQDMGALQLEKCSIVHESVGFSEEDHSLNNNMQFLQSMPLTQVPENHYEGFAGHLYGISTGNGWLDHGIAHDAFPTTFSEGMFCKGSQTFSPYPTDESLADQFEQHEEKQMVHGECAYARKVYDKERERKPVDFLKDLALPWEVSCPDENARLEEAKECTDERRHEDFPRLPPVRVRSIDNNLNILKETSRSRSFESGANNGHQGTPNTGAEPSFNLGSFLDIPVGQAIALSGAKLQNGSSRLSVSQGIVEDTPELLSGFATLSDEPGECVAGNAHGYWDSDTYEDDEDPGYHKQPIEDEAWFLANEIDFPSDDDKAKSNMAGSSTHCNKDHHTHEDDDLSQVEEESYFSGEQFYTTGQNELHSTPVYEQDGTNFFGRSSQNNLMHLNRIVNATYDGQLMDSEEFKLMRAEPLWQGFISQTNQLSLLGGDEDDQDLGRPHKQYYSDVDDKQGSLRSSGVGVSSEVADLGSEAKDSMFALSSEWERESLQEQELQGYQVTQLMFSEDCTSNTMSRDGVRHCSGFAGENDGALRCPSSDWLSKVWTVEKQNLERSSSGPVKVINVHPTNHVEDGEEGFGFGIGGFSFPSPSKACDLAAPKADSGKPLWVTEKTPVIEGTDIYGTCITGPDETLASWKRKSNESSPILSPRGEAFLNSAASGHSTVPAHSLGDDLLHCERDKRGNEVPAKKEDTDATVVDDEEIAAQEQFGRIKAEEEDFEIFNLRIVHRKNRTGFEEEKSFPVVINSVVAGRYIITEYLGSAAFSKAIQARDIQTGMDVCMKIIKNNKDFFDQSLDEIKLLKFINKHDPADRYHILRLYDYFYYREHLFIVCELLRANLYEFHKFNRESGGEVYFTMSRLQSITRQCLEALEFLHSLGLIHCDLKPENILIKSYSRCEVKVIDLGSSCFQTDHLCPYVQSRSYRAPEVILGLPYNEKIDIWSLGCILAELCSGNVLFQNDSLATLLARVVGIIGPINPEMLAKGRDTHKYFTKNYMLYERNQDTSQLEYIVPKKTSLRHRLPMGDQGFVDFVGYLLQVNAENRPSASEALKHPWLSYPYEPISS